MSGYSLIIREFQIVSDRLRITAVLSGNNDKIPKLKIIFNNGKTDRRLPLLLSRKDGNDLVFSYTYFLGKLFYEQQDEGTVNVSFEVYDNDEFIPLSVAEFENVRLPFRFSPGRKTLTFSSYRYAVSFDEGKFIIGFEKNTDYVLKFFVYICRALTALFTALSGFILLFIFGIKDAVLAKLSPKGTLKLLRKDLADYVRFVYNDNDATLFVRRLMERSVVNYYEECCKMPVVQNRIAFISGRRDELGGNEKFVYDLLKDIDGIEIVTLMSSSLARGSDEADKRRFYELYATSRVVVVDDHFTLLDSVEKREGVTLFQLWHACGAFKTFGFSRLGKAGGPTQASTAHRMYDFATVSSHNIIKHYAEGFGVGEKNIIATGIPRTDVFFDDGYGEKIRDSFYTRYPYLRDKKIALFAPTFRGAGKNSAFYPTDKFSPADFIDRTKGEYCLIIKLHPFCKEKFVIDDKYGECIIDLSSEDELNDLLFVTDLLITDYSSSVFEASLLNVPMLFYAYDLDEYISDRDFYCDFRSFVPGKITGSFDEMIDAVNDSDFETDKIPSFRSKYFDFIDGKSSQRVADAILNELNLSDRQ